MNAETLFAELAAFAILASLVATYQVMLWLACAERDRLREQMECWRERALDAEADLDEYEDRYDTDDENEEEEESWQ